MAWSFHRQVSVNHAVHKRVKTAARYEEIILPLANVNIIRLLGTRNGCVQV